MCSKFNNKKTLSIWEIKTILKKLSFYTGFRFRRSNAHELEMKQGRHMMAPWGGQLLKETFVHPGHPRELWDHPRGAKHVRESESDVEIVPKRPKLEKMRKSRKT